MMGLDEIRDAAEEAFAKIDRNPDRLHELDADDLTAIAVQIKLALPMMEQTLLSFCNGDTERANAALTRVGTFKQAKLVRLVRECHTALRTHRNPSLYQIAALVVDLQVGVGAVTVEQERRDAVRGRAMN